jgi:predicted transcriptional regulator YheO
MLVDFIAECFGDNVEVVLHDLTDLQHSVVAIRNGHITGREIGSPLSENVKISEFFVDKITTGSFIEKKRLMNYKGTTPTGKPLRCSSMFLFDESGEAIGLLCINIDLSEYKRAEEIIAKLSFINPPNTEDDETKWVKNHPASLNAMVSAALEEVLSGKSVPIDRLNSNEKMKIVEQLRNKGLFQIKGAVSEVAARLLISESTIYRYINIISRRKAHS